MIYHNEGKSLVKIWANEVEESAMEQIKNLSNLPYVFHHVSVMADCHAGFGCPIGTVIATKDVICPSLVGVDINCGVACVKSNVQADEVTQEMFKQILGGSAEYKGGVRAKVPVGFSHHETSSEEYEKNLEIADKLLQEFYEVV